ncbi:MAG: hypothetical protein GKR89_30925 [Candidatus Latescibacteria bacterium]|nr:hypothetical protein [Candidatus Latescibacterota bacterium]
MDSINRYLGGVGGACAAAPVLRVLERLTVLWLVLVLVGPVQSQQTLSLSLEQARQRALAGNLLLEVARSEVERARALQVQALAGRLPQVRLSERALRSNDAVDAFGFKLKQESFTEADFAVGRLNKPAAVTDFQTRLEINQPLVGGQALYGRQQANAVLAVATSHLQRQEQEIVHRATTAYWGLVLAREELKAVRQGLATAQKLAALTQAHYQQQTVARTDLLAAQMRVAELAGEEIAAVNRIGQANDGLSLVLGLGSAVQLVPLDSLGRRPPLVDLSELVVRARQMRPDLKALQYQVEAARRGIQIEQAAYLPQLNAFARMDLDADQAFARQGESWMVGAVLQWDLFAGMSRVGAVRQAKARWDQARTQDTYLQQQIERQVRQAVRGVAAAKRQIEVGRQAVGHAREGVRISQLQYTEGLITATDLLSAETGLTRARIRHLQALYELEVELGQLAFAVGQTVD